MLTSSNLMVVAFVALAMQLLSLDRRLIPLAILAAAFLAIRFALAESNVNASSLTSAEPS